MAQTGKDANSSAPTQTVPAARIEFLPEDRRWITDRIEEILESGQLTLGKYGAAFEEKFAELQKYKDDNGDCSVPRGWAENKALGAWVDNQRTEKRNLDRDGNAKITPARIAKLDGIEFDWNPGRW